MALDTIAGRLSALDMFRGLSRQQIDRISREADRIVFRAGQAIVEAGSEAAGALILISGRARAVSPDDPGFEQDVPTGTMLGETAMLTEHEFSVTVVAETDVRAIMVTRETLLRQMQEDAELAEHFHARLAARLQRVAIELRMIDERLAVASQLAVGGAGA